ncbi:hypothetical protein Taro_049506 [Colocasia esculenta]|uniref:RING-type E3 ubiquitin transferase n=1 Tax=Colocasia esculenta TaxID=4460 RepID=A0A843XAY7_COLES|nr:hypothetical protein [Colocasia esculenta]
MDACSPLQKANAVGAGAGRVGVLLIARGACSFEKKVRNAQDAGYRASIVYDDRDKTSLISMIGNPEGISTQAVFVSKMAGETLKKLAEDQGGECCISYRKEETAGTVLVISFVSLVVIVSVLATSFFARNCRPLRHAAHNRHPQNINRQEVEVLPSFKFKAAYPNNKHMSETCAICLEDYKDGETLRVLPCLHEFHSVCVDSWLTKWGTFCPVCKHDMSSGR